MVRTSPGLTLWPGAFSRTPLMRTWPASTSAAAEVRAFTTRACHNHLSRRWRSKRHHPKRFQAKWAPVRVKKTPQNKKLPILAVGGELLLERRQLGEWRIGVDRALAFARRRGGGVLPVRRPRVASAVIAAGHPRAAALSISLLSF